ncbi:MAG: hypothetical protein K8U57_00840 [Planctomycetes bacterium]|nr:hypothetical protein [Planctomycetota bacterium]
MAKRFSHLADIGGDDEKVPYSPNPRPDRGKWCVVFIGPDGKRKRLLTTHDYSPKIKSPPAEFHADAAKLIRDLFRPPSMFPSKERRSWDELLDEVEKTSPHTRAETLRGFRSGVRAFREVLPEVASPLEVTEDRIRRFSKLWLATPKANGDKRSPVSLSYYLRSMSAFTNHLISLGYLSKNLWRGVKAPKAEHTRKPVPTEEETTAFFSWVHSRYPQWKSLHALLELKAISASRTADVCQIKTEQLRGGHLTFAAATTKTKVARSLPLPDELSRTLTAVAGKEHLWEKLFSEIPKYRKSSNGYPDSFSWKTVYFVVNNLFREFNEAHPDKPHFNAHGLRRRAITATVAATGSVDAAASAIGVHPQTARAHYLDAQKAFQTDEVMKKVAEALRPKIKPPESHQGG